jgi:26S proteasome regulatory subunit T5
MAAKVAEPKKDIFEDPEFEALGREMAAMSTQEIEQRLKLLDNDIRIMRTEVSRIQHEQKTVGKRIKENQEKVKLNKQLPYLVGHVVEVQ